jgi:hypothetical protein
MASFGMLRCVALVRTDVSNEGSVSIIRARRIGELDVSLNQQPMHATNTYKSHTA